MHVRTRLRSAPIAIALVLAGASAFAAPPKIDPAVAKRAGDLFKEGRAAANAGDDKTACERFTESEELQPAPGTQANLGGCEAKQGHLLAAREHFRKAGAGFKPDDERRAVAVNSANDITDRLPVLTVHLATTAPPQTQVTLEGAPLDLKVLEHGIELDPGVTKLVVTSPGRQPHPYEVELKEAEKRDLTVDIGDAVVAAGAEVPAVTGTAEPVSATSSDDARASRRKLERTLGYVGVGTGVVGIVVGSVFGSLAFSEASTVKANCTASYACRPAGVAAASSGSTDGTVSTAAFIVGGVFAAAGAYLVITTWGADPAEKHDAPQSVVVAPQAFLSGGGATATWTF